MRLYWPLIGNFLACKQYMRYFIYVFAGVLLVINCTPSWAEDTIYTWTDQQNDLTNYAGIPPDDQIGTDNLKVFSPEKGLVTNANLPVRDMTAPSTPLIPSKPSSTTNQSQPATSPGAPPTMTQTPIASSKPIPPAPPVEEANKLPTNTRMLTQGTSQPNFNTANDSEEKHKISEQVNRIEESSKSAKKVAEERRLEEMKELAERVRNGAATKKEIAALMMYRQTASFKDARRAMSTPVKTVNQSFE